MANEEDIYNSLNHQRLYCCDSPYFGNSQNSYYQGSYYHLCLVVVFLTLHWWSAFLKHSNPHSNSRPHRSFEQCFSVPQTRLLKDIMWLSSLQKSHCPLNVLSPLTCFYGFHCAIGVYDCNKCNPYQFPLNKKRPKLMICVYIFITPFITNSSQKTPGEPASEKKKNLLVRVQN